MSQEPTCNVPVSDCPLAAHKRLNETELDAVKDDLLKSIYQDIGKSVAEKILWVIGALALAALAWMNGSGHIVIGK